MSATFKDVLAAAARRSFSSWSSRRIDARAGVRRTPRGVMETAEALEARRLLAVTAAITSNVLIVTGTTGADDIEIYQTSTNNTVSVYDHTNLVGSFAVANFNSILVNADSGDDEVFIGSSYSDGGGVGAVVVSKPAVINGDAGADTLYGTDQADTISGGANNDLLFASLGADYLYGQSGADSLVGDSGADTLEGGSEGDTLHGGDNNDVVFGGDGNDTADGGAGDDVMYGEAGDDTMTGGNDADTIWGDDLAGAVAGSDSLRGGSGGDYIAGGYGDDTVLGDSGADTLYGDYSATDTDTGGADLIVGGTGSDGMYGGYGNDTLNGATDEFFAETDFLDGGEGSDTAFVNGSDSHSNCETVI